MQRLSRTLIQLNLATREHHAAADAPWLDLMVPSVTTQDYVKQLIKIYGFEAPLEAALRYTPGLATVIDLRAHTRSGLIAQDLIRLGMSAARVTELQQRFITFSSAVEALGWMYVAERATLLHSGVRRHLTLRLPETAAASSYLSAYDGVIGQRWSDLGNALDAMAQSPSVKRQLLSAADQGFVALFEWLYDVVALRSVGT